MIPIFIVGSPRCGTTCLSRCIRSSPGLPGYDEGHFLTNLLDFAVLRHTLSEKIRENPHESNPDVAASHFPEYITEQMLYGIFKRAYENICKKQYEKLYVIDSDKKREPLPLSHKYFVDKSPGPKGILICKYLIKIWPNAKFIFMKRRSIENIFSRMKKFENNDYTVEKFTKHCNQWVNDMNYWYSDTKPHMPNSSYIEIDQYDIMHHPKGVISRICNLIPDLLDYKAQMINYMKNQFPESTNPDQPPTILSINSVAWKQEFKNIHNNICKNDLDKYNYTLDINYRKK